MAIFGTLSKKNLAEVHPKLIAVLNLAIMEVDFTVICGRRGKADQELAFRKGNTKVHYPNSAHNPLPACAVDFIPYPFKSYNDFKSFEKIGRTIQLCGEKLHISIRWGGDWNMNGTSSDEKFLDSGHVELNPWRNFAHF